MRVLSRAVILSLVLWFVAVSGCGDSAATKIQGSWTGPAGAVLKITPTQWILSASLVDVTLNSKVARSDGDVVVVTLTTSVGSSCDVTCRVDGNTLRITEPLDATFAVGGTWNRN